MVGFGFTARPVGIPYDQSAWIGHLTSFMDALGIARAHLVGNSFGGALALALAALQPNRVDRLVLMGSVGVKFPLTPGLDAAWGYKPSVKNMRRILDLFAFDKSLVGDELAELRYRASIRPGFQESFSAMFPEPRQNGIDNLAVDEDAIRGIRSKTLIVHGREDQIIPFANSLRLFELIPQSELHAFGNCGHWTQIEHAGRFNLLITEFLEG
jgi:pimeloyl-ACP methyl ester carboxylesterase